MSRPIHAVHALRILVLLAVPLLSATRARADTQVDTEYQSWGIAPRIELEVGPQLVWGAGHACRDEPVASGAAEKTSCDSGFPVLGGQALALIRPVRHWALGPFFAYDVVLGAHEVSIDKDGSKKASYKRSSQRLGVQLRWYSRSVSTSGFYVAVHAGALWWSDKVKPITDGSLSQLAPEYGFELGGVFAPYRGFGMTLGVQAWMAWLSNSPQRNTSSNGSTYGYGPFVFAGIVSRFELGFSL